ncbi:MAG: family 43 glycosylhydrolase [Muribaculaceae bacterium]|nr:family 43 glycosylhydrolase [Muribaculaceae bacterium]
MKLKKSLLLISVLCGVATAFASELKQGDVWTDTDGNPINAHGGGILFHNGTYYWYGESKGENTYRSPGIDWECFRTDAGGVGCYSSKNLKDWKFEGIVLKPEIENTRSDIHPTMVIERPKVIYNDSTGKFVMWMHIDNAAYNYARCGVAVSDSPVGPFVYLRSERPNGSECRDMTLFKDIDGSGYLIYSSEGNSTLHISKLSDDFLSQSGVYSVALKNQSREAPAIFKHGDFYFMVTSGCSGWSPNEAEYAVASSIMGPWKTVGNPCSGKDSDKTFYCQSTYVIPVSEDGSEDYVIMFDRWNKSNLIDSRYVWLPIKVDGENIDIPWNENVPSFKD